MKQPVQQELEMTLAQMKEKNWSQEEINRFVLNRLISLERYVESLDHSVTFLEGHEH